MACGEYDWDLRNYRLRKGDAPWSKMTMEEEEVLIHSAGSAWNPELEDTNMYQTDSRDCAADRDADAYERNSGSPGLMSRSRQMRASSRRILSSQNLRKGLGTYKYCAWCDTSVSSPSGLWNHYDAVHGVNMQVAPFTPPSVWQTLLGRDMRSRAAHFLSPARELNVLGDTTTKGRIWNHGQKVFCEMGRKCL